MRPAAGKLNRKRATAAALAVALLCLAGGGAGAADIDALYRSDAIVTGTGEANREVGFRECLREVLVKLSGDPAITEAPGFAAAEARADSFVSAFSYRDRLEGIPIHDEQGTHDRPHDLTCRYRPATLDSLLADLGRKPWLSPRPRIAVWLAVKDQKRRFVLARDGSESPYMADSLQAAAEPLALSAVLPDAATVTARKSALDTLPQADPAQLFSPAAQADGDVPLIGTLVWSDAARGWIAQWQMDAGGRRYRWQVSGVSFDDAFRNAMRGAARILSGNGAP
ncbi:DUF2066 domain-containing protein [Ensifer sp. PDNC004]|uniref:DUF2066 domain-containing protein n=1 Tax=Ensifer sp. PDNC004 TaxID=2811423 RepID=UPI0019636540|nr:DUF2066 domain-containing protein [Ensifer sp. PDNC004]QRY68157.1 DUF2066 domain-containing protein [Ensifer sp. PDNC004]